MTGPEWTVDAVDAGQRLDKWLAAPQRLRSRGNALSALERRRVFADEVEQGLADAARRVTAGERIRVWSDRPGSARARGRRRAGDLAILFEDDAIIVLDKPAGLLTVPLPEQPDEPSLEQQVAEHWRSHGRRRPLVVHRIDRDTSGLVVFARRPEAWRALKEQFVRREPERVYCAVVEGVPRPAAGRWRDWVRWDPVRVCQVPSARREFRALEAVSDYTVVEAFAAASRLEVRLRTGRRHQIRVQAWLHGHALVGERMYRGPAPSRDAGPSPGERYPAGGPDADDARRRAPDLARQALHAMRLAFRHPASGEIARFEAPLPADLGRLLARLREAHGPAFTALDP